MRTRLRKWKNKCIGSAVGLGAHSWDRTREWDWGQCHPNYRNLCNMKEAGGYWEGNSKFPFNPGVNCFFWKKKLIFWLIKNKDVSLRISCSINIRSMYIFCFYWGCTLFSWICSMDFLYDIFWPWLWREACGILFSFSARNPSPCKGHSARSLYTSH